MDIQLPCVEATCVLLSLSLDPRHLPRGKMLRYEVPVDAVY